MSMQDLVSTEWLAAELGKPDLVVFDATNFLPNENQDGKANWPESGRQYRCVSAQARNIAALDQPRDVARQIQLKPAAEGRVGKILRMTIEELDGRCDETAQVGRNGVGPVAFDPQQLIGRRAGRDLDQPEDEIEILAALELLVE